MTFSLSRPGPAVDTGQPAAPPGGIDTMTMPARAPKSAPDLKRRQARRAMARLIAEKGLLRALQPNGQSQHPSHGRPEDLLADIMVAHLDTLMRRVCDACDRTAAASAKHQLEAIVAAFLGCALEERNEHRLLLRSGDVLDERGQVSVYGRYRSLAGLCAEVLETAAPRATPAAAMVAAMSLLSAMSCAALWFHDDGAVSVAAYGRMLTAMTIVGVRRNGLGAGPEVAVEEKCGGKTP
jgi:hypothetical protein